MSGEDPDASAGPRSDGGTELPGRGEAVRDESAPAESASVESVPDEAAPTESAPDEAAPTESAPDEAAPDEEHQHGRPTTRDDATDDLWTESAIATSPDSEGLCYELPVYAELLDALLARGYEFVGFDGPIEDGQIALRHDVDISLERAAAMARVEAERGIASTYLFLVTNPLYDLLAPESRRRLREIVGAGHDVGLHFDPHYYWDEEPAVDALEARVLADRAALERALEAAGSLASGTGVAATSIHQPPDWALGVDYDAFESTYQPRYFLDVSYVSDSGGKWRTERPFTDGVPEAMQLLIHPGLWQSEDRELSTILEDHRERCHDRIERYVGPFGG